MVDNVSSNNRYDTPCCCVAIIATVSHMTQSMLDRTLAGRIRARLQEMDMSQAEFGRRMGLGVDATSRRMRGKTRFKAAEIPRAAKILKTPVAELLEEDR